MSELITAKMPDAAEVTRRLIAANNEPHLIEGFYPLVVAKMADKELAALGVVMGMNLAVADYTRDLPPIMGMMMTESLFLYVRALLEGTAILADAMDTLETLGLPTSCCPTRACSSADRAPHHKVEADASAELIELRARVANVLGYLDHVTTPNVHTLSHVRRILNGEQ